MFFKKKTSKSNDIEPIQSKPVKSQTNKIETKPETEIKNIALELFLNFGDNSMELTNSRLKDIIPGLSDEDAEKYYKISSEIRKNVYEVAERLYLKQITQQEAKQLIHTSYPFISDKNCIHMCSTGMYKAWQKYNE